MALFIKVLILLENVLIILEMRKPPEFIVQLELEDYIKNTKFLKSQQLQKN